MTAVRQPLAPGHLVTSDGITGTVQRVEHRPFLGEQLYVKWHIAAFESPLAIAPSCTR